MQAPPTSYTPGEGVNHLTLRVQFHANECNEGRDADPQPQERNSTLTSGTNSLKHMRKSRGPSIYACTRSIMIISHASYLLYGGVDILATSVFDCPLFSPDFIILFENSALLGLGVSSLPSLHSLAWNCTLGVGWLAPFPGIGVRAGCGIH